VKTVEQIVTYKQKCLDGRDVERLGDFVPEAQLGEIGLAINPGEKGKHVPQPLTREAIIERMKDDVAFGFEKFLNHRNISTNFMSHVVLMWLWVLDDTDFDKLFGGDLFEAVAKKYDFPIPEGLEDEDEED